jgi:hypothetical protein
MILTRLTELAKLNETLDFIQVIYFLLLSLQRTAFFPITAFLDKVGFAYYYDTGF